ncbi:hypothetical protein SVAN01_07886 [Stagonosporopsis vannaccii]|nr:hypothetical protein SVAN01_07886 [Stagonosporopsis vannaccii]
MYITITASSSKPSTATSSQRESTITSATRSKPTKTVKQPSATGEPSLPSVSLELSSSLTSGSSSTAHSEPPAIYTRIVSADSMCPYPLPGVYCGGPKTTLVTRARDETASMTSPATSAGVPQKSKEPGWCPYPGQSC